jgi:hypothetical protein
MIRFKHIGDFSKTDKYFKNLSNREYLSILDKYGKQGVEALASATPVDTGKTASSWSYRISKENGRYVLEWDNENIQNGVNIAIILQYGHGTNNGGYVQGRDYINPAIRPIFDSIVEEAWKEVKNS